MTIKRQSPVPYEIAAALDLRPDERPPFARWRYGVRAGFRSGLGYAVLQFIFFLGSRGHWPATGRAPLLQLAATDFLGIPIFLGVLALLLPLMRTMRRAVALGVVVGACLGAGILVAQEGPSTLFQPVEGLMVLLGMAFCTFVFVLMREFAIVRWHRRRGVVDGAA